MCSKNIKYKHRKLICVLTNKLLEIKGFKQEILKSTKSVYYGFSHLLYIQFMKDTFFHELFETRNH